MHTKNMTWCIVNAQHREGKCNQNWMTAVKEYIIRILIIVKGIEASSE